METIKNYLENMFMNLPKSREVNKAKEELLAMMEDKYNELKQEGKTENEAIGIVISEFGNLDELAGELGIKDYVNGAEDGVVKKNVSMEAVKDYIQNTEKHSLNIAIGVMLCIWSPILLIILAGMQEADKAITDSTIGIFGVSFLVILVAIAVGIFIMNSMALEKYEYLKKEVLQLDFSTDTYVRDQKENNKSNFAIKITIGVVLCILSVIPVIAIGSAYQENTILESVSVGVMLFIVSISVLLFITAGMKEECYKVLLQEEEYNKSIKEDKLTGVIASIYWPVMTCIYLAWSFITFDWGITWIIWPIAGVLFGAIASICSIIGKNNS